MYLVRPTERLIAQTEGTLENPLTWREIAQGISQGSWAVMLSLFLVYIMIRKPLSGFIDAQVKTLEAMREAIAKNSDAIASIQRSSAAQEGKITEIIRKVDHLHDQADDILDLVKDIKTERSCQTPDTIKTRTIRSRSR